MLVFGSESTLPAATIKLIYNGRLKLNGLIAFLRNVVLASLTGAVVGVLPAQAIAEAQPDYALSMHGDVALPADFTHFPYANADAPKGGAITMGVNGTFDSLNPFVLKSMRTTARGLFGDVDLGNLAYETLMQRSRDEPFTLYGLLAEKVAVDPDRKWVEFTLNPKAKWSDGQPVTVDDVLFTYDILTEKGRPPYNNRMSRIDKIEKTGERSVRFTFNDKSDREFPMLIASSMPVLPKHAIDRETFGNSSLKPPVGSGPYLVSGVQPGQRIIYKRNPDYWGKDLPSQRGLNNFDTLTIEYYRNETSLFESFKKGLLDVFIEANPTRWEKLYDFPAVKQGRVIKDSFEKARLPTCLASCSTHAAQFSPTVAYGRLWGCCSISNGPTATFSPINTAARRVFGKDRSFLPSASLPMSAKAVAETIPRSRSRRCHERYMAPARNGRQRS